MAEASVAEGTPVVVADREEAKAEVREEAMLTATKSWTRWWLA